MKRSESPAVAWLIPFMARGYYWYPILAEFSRLFPRTTVFSCLRTVIPAQYAGSFSHRFVGRARNLTLKKADRSHNLVMTLLPVRAMYHIARFRPRVIFASGFNAWSALSLVLRMVFRFRVIVVYDGSSPGVDSMRKKTRLLMRKAMARRADAFITNSRMGRKYLIDVLRAEEGRVFSRPYLVPCAAALSTVGAPAGSGLVGLRRPVFLYVGRIAHLKGLSFLLDACAILAAQGRRDFTVLMVGDGPQRAELEERSRRLAVQDLITWAGWVEYGRLGSYFDFADVFVFPTLTDVWGMAVLEAMAFSKPVLCSRWAGASELVIEGENGIVFDPHQPEELAERMKLFIDDPSKAGRMGRRAGDLISGNALASAAAGLGEAVRFVLRGEGGG